MPASVILGRFLRLVRRGDGRASQLFDERIDARARILIGGLGAVVAYVRMGEDVHLLRHVVEDDQ